MSRVIAWLAFLLGSGASVAANVAHARPELGPRLTAAFAPLALVLAVELAVRVQWRRGLWWTVGRWGGTGLVAAVTAVVSYRHQVGLLGSYGEDSINAGLLPLSVDGLMITAAAALMALGGTQTGPAVEGEGAAVIGGSPPPDLPDSGPASLLPIVDAGTVAGVLRPGDGARPVLVERSTGRSSSEVAGPIVAHETDPTWLPGRFRPDSVPGKDGEDGLITEARAAASALQFEGLPLTRDNLARWLRDRGRAVSTTRATELLRQLRAS